MNHAMLDIETLSTEKDAAILSIGLVLFDPASGEVGEHFYREVQLQSSLNASLKIDASTLKFWIEQGDEAQRLITSRMAQPLGHVLDELSNFLWAHCEPSKLQVWGNGPSFDCVIVGNAYSALSKKTPWKYYNERCVRTIVELGRAIGIDPKKQLAFTGRKHHALDDAMHQAKYVSVIWQRLTQGPELTIPEATYFLKAGEEVVDGKKLEVPEKPEPPQPRRL